MDSLDTNVLVRYFTNDDEVQSKIASGLIAGYVGKEKSLFISNIVICELLWFLIRGYKYKKIPNNRVTYTNV
jgi:predicted nucleic-acid-binding protein